MAATCRVCLCIDRSMYAINNTVYIEVWEKLTSALFNPNDGKPPLVCYICGAQLIKSHQLMKRAQRAEELLTAVIGNGSEQSQQAILLLASQMHDFNYKYVIGEMCQLECKEFERNTVGNIKKENEWGIEEYNEKENDINTKEEAGGNTEAEIEKENVEVSEEGNKEENDINIKEEAGGNTIEEIEKKYVGVSEEGNEKGNDINIKEEAGGNTEEEINKENVGASEEGNEEENDIHIKVEERDSNPEENVDIADVQSGPPSCDDMLLKKIPEREVRIILELIDTGAVTKRKSNEVPQKGTRIKLDEINEDMKCLTNVAVENLANNNCKTLDMSYSKHLSLETNNSTNFYQVNKFSPIQAKDIIEQNDKTLISNICYNNTKNKILKQCLSKSTDAVAASSYTNKKGSINQFSCHICQHKCVTKSMLNIHLRTHTGEKPHICDYCDYRCSRKSDLQRHINHKHTKEKNFSCHVCQYKCVSKRDLNVHLRTHTGEKPFICDSCDYRCALKYRLREHIMYKHTKEKKFSCHICQFKCVTKRDLNVHLRTHTGEKLFICDFCDYRCTRKHRLNDHVMFKHTKEKNFTCHICQFKCVTKTNLNIHLRKHAGKKPYMCDYCDYRCTLKHHLTSHIMYKHTKENNFSCHICEFNCASKRDLNIHLRIHTGEKPFICDFCDYRCSRKQRLREHVMYKHTKEKNFSCHICQYKFVSKRDLNVHLHTHTGCAEARYYYY